MSKGKAIDNLKSGSGSDTGFIGQVYIGSGAGTKKVDIAGAGTTVVVPSDTMTTFDAKKRYLENPKVEAGWLNTLKKNGYGDVSPAKAKILYEFAIDEAGKWYQQSSGSRKISPEQYIQWYAKDQGKLGGGGPAVTIQKYLFQPEEIQSLINDTLKNVLGRKATQSESKEFYTAIQQMIDAGTITTTKKVGGKTIVETKPGYSKEKAETFITEKVKADSPQDYQEAQSLGFADFLGKLKG